MTEFMDENPRARFGRDVYFDRNGVPLTLREWAALIEGDVNMNTYKRVAEDQIDMYWVSTVWIGLDMSMLGSRPPLIFETMVFLKPDETDGLQMDMYQHRYATEAEALAGHEAVCAEIRVKQTQLREQQTHHGDAS